MSKLAVIFGGPSPEHDISILTGLQAARELTQAGNDVTCLYWTKTGDWYSVSPNLEGKDFLEGLPRNAEPLQFVAVPGGGFASAKKGLFGKAAPLEIETAVVCCHGGPGEDGSLQAALDLAGVSYTGPSVAGAALGMDKLAFGGVISAAGLPSLPRVAVDVNTQSLQFDGPYILKPRFGGSSIGIEVVDSLDTAKALIRSSPHLRAGAVIEPYKPNSIDLNIAVRMFPQFHYSAIEKPTRNKNAGNQILGYADKYIGGEGMVSAPRELPADIKPELTDAIRAMAFDIANLVGLRGVQRIDFLADDEQLFINEINTIPGSLSKHLFVEPVVPFVKLLQDMINEATARPATHWTAAGADGTALRTAGNIAGKLS